MEAIKNQNTHPDISHIPNGMEQMIERSKNMSSSEWDKELKAIKRDQMGAEEAIARDRRRQANFQPKASRPYMFSNAPKSKREDMDADTAKSKSQALANYRKSQGWDGVPLRQKLRSINAEIFDEVDREASRKTARPTTTDEAGKKPQYPIDMHRFTKMADEAYDIVHPILGLGDSIDKYLSLMVEYSLTFSTDFETYLTSIGVSDNLMSEILHRYEVYHKGDHDIVFFRMDKHGKTLNGNIITIDETGKVDGCRRVFSHHSYYDMCWSFGTAFFGGHLLGKINDRKKPVFIVQDEINAILGAIVYPDLVWLALGTGQNLTEDHLKLLEGQMAVLYPDDTAEPYWAELASKFPNANVHKSFVDKEMTAYFVNAIKQRRK